MAKITIGLGFMRTPEQEQELQSVAAALPDDCAIEMQGGPGGSGVWNVRISGPSFEGRFTFGPNDDAADATRLLQDPKLLELLTRRPR